MIDCDRVASGFGCRLLGIPVATLGMFAHFFILFLILTERSLKLGIQTELHHLIYVIILMMVLFSIYEAFVSFVILGHLSHVHRPVHNHGLDADGL